MREQGANVTYEIYDSDIVPYFIGDYRRDLNYNQFFSEGSEMKDITDYNSNNTKQLDIKKVKELLLNLDYVSNILSENNF